MLYLCTLAVLIRQVGLLYLNHSLHSAQVQKHIVTFYPKIVLIESHNNSIILTFSFWIFWDRNHRDLCFDMGIMEEDDTCGVHSTRNTFENSPLMHISSNQPWFSFYPTTPTLYPNEKIVWSNSWSYRLYFTIPLKNRLRENGRFKKSLCQFWPNPMLNDAPVSEAFCFPLWYLSMGQC